MSDYKTKMNEISRLIDVEGERQEKVGEQLLALADDVEVLERMHEVDGSSIDRVTRELIARGGDDEVLGKFLSQKVMEFYAETYPDECV